jgi:hypothetical protein
MTKNGIVLTVIAVLLAAVYVYSFTDWFRKETIQIIPTIRPGRALAMSNDPKQPPVYPVSFALDGKYRLTSIKVVAADDLATNKYPVPLWHLISDSNSVPTKAIMYGQAPRGMKPSIPRTRPEPLLPEIDYVLLLVAGSTRAQTNVPTAQAVASGK